MKLIKLLIRILFLGFLSYHAYTSLTNLKKNGEIFQTSFSQMEETLFEKFEIKLPNQIQSKNINSEQVVKIIDILVLFLSLLSLFIPSTTVVVGMIFFLNSIIYNNYFLLNKNSDMTNFEPLCINTAIFGLSMMLSCCGGANKCGKVENESQTTVPKKTERKNSKGGRKKNIKRD